MEKPGGGARWRAVLASWLKWLDQVVSRLFRRLAAAYIVVAGGLLLLSNISATTELQLEIFLERQSALIGRTLYNLYQGEISTRDLAFEGAQNFSILMDDGKYQEALQAGKEALERALQAGSGFPSEAAIALSLDVGDVAFQLEAWADVREYYTLFLTLASQVPSLSKAAESAPPDVDSKVVRRFDEEHYRVRFILTHLAYDAGQPIEAMHHYAEILRRGGEALLSAESSSSIGALRGQIRDGATFRGFEVDGSPTAVSLQTAALSEVASLMAPDVLSALNRSQLEDVLLVLQFVNGHVNDITPYIPLLDTIVTSHGSSVSDSMASKLYLLQTEYWIRLYELQGFEAAGNKPTGQILANLEIVGDRATRPVVTAEKLETLADSFDSYDMLVEFARYMPEYSGDLNREILARWEAAACRGVEAVEAGGAPLDESFSFVRILNSLLRAVGMLEEAHNSPTPPRECPEVSEEALKIAYPELADDLAKAPGDDFKTVELLYGTTRQWRSGSRRASKAYRNRDDRQNSDFRRGVVEVTIPICSEKAQLQAELDNRPCGHQPGEIQSKGKFLNGKVNRADRTTYMIMSMPQPLSGDSYGERMRELTCIGSGGGQNGQDCPHTKRALIFIHGYNTTFEEAALKTAQIAYDLQFEGLPAFYSWPSRAQWWRYKADQKLAAWVRSDMKDFIVEIVERSGAREVHVIAHSMGNLHLLDALEELAAEMEPGSRLFNEIIMAAPDVEAGKLATSVKGLMTIANRMTLYASRDDKALRLSKLVNGDVRAGLMTGGDNRRPVVSVEGMLTVDATDTATEFSTNGHGYFSQNTSILSDMKAAIWLDLEPDNRCILTMPVYMTDNEKEAWRQSQPKAFWQYSPGECGGSAADVEAWDSAMSLMVQEGGAVDGASVNQALQNSCLSLARAQDKYAETIRALDGNSELSKREMKRLKAEGNVHAARVAFWNATKAALEKHFLGAEARDCLTIRAEGS